MNSDGEHLAPTSVSDVENEGKMATGERFRPLVLAGMTLLLAALCAWLAIPFLPALSWAVALAIITWPLHTWLVCRIGRQTPAALLATLAVVVIILVPGFFVSYQLAREAGSAAAQMENDEAQRVVRDTAAQVPVLDRAVAWMDRAGVDVDREVRRLMTRFFGDVVAMMRGSLAAFLQFAVMLYVLYYLLRDGPALLRSVRRLLPLGKTEADRVFSGVIDSVHANLYASVVTSMVNGIVMGLLFWMIGLPSPTLWGVVTFVLSIVPILGVFLIWVPAAIYLAITGRWPGAAAMFTWGLLSAALVDTLLYMYLAGERMRLHPVPMFITFIGGLALFGPSGIVLGPAILAVTVALLEVWHYRANPDAPGNDDSPKRDPARSVTRRRLELSSQ